MTCCTTCNVHDPDTYACRVANAYYEALRYYIVSSGRLKCAMLKLCVSRSQSGRSETTHGIDASARRSHGDRSTSTSSTGRSDF